MRTITTACSNQASVGLDDSSPGAPSGAELFTLPRDIRCQQFRQAVIAFGGAVLHARLDDRVANLLGDVENSARQSGLAVFLRQRKCVDGFARIIVERLGGNQTIGRRDLTIYAAHTHASAIGSP